jgi:peptide subunit release factor 1 (eRF1)
MFVFKTFVQKCVSGQKRATTPVSYVLPEGKNLPDSITIFSDFYVDFTVLTSLHKIE